MENKERDYGKIEIDDRFIKLYNKYMARKIETKTELAQRYGISRTTMYRMIKEYEAMLEED